MKTDLTELVQLTKMAAMPIHVYVKKIKKDSSSPESIDRWP